MAALTARSPSFQVLVKALVVVENPNLFVEEGEIDSTALEVENPLVEEALVGFVGSVVGVANPFVEEREVDSAALVAGSSSVVEVVVKAVLVVENLFVEEGEIDLAALEVENPFVEEALVGAAWAVVGVANPFCAPVAGSPSAVVWAVVVVENLFVEEGKIDLAALKV